MPDQNASMVKLVKQAAVEAVEAGNPVQIAFGTVVSASPLKIGLEQKLVLERTNLILTRSVTDYEIEMTVDHTTGYASGGSGYDLFASHAHSYTGTKKFKVKGALKTGEKVLLLRMQGGQKYIVLDRLE